MFGVVMETLKLEAAKKIRFYSDMHLDFYADGKRFNPSQLWEPEVLEDDKESILVLAGDIWHAKKPFKFTNYSWMGKMSSRFKYVLVVLGNHDFWSGQLPTEYDNFNKYAKEQSLDNVILLQNSQVIIGEHKFVGATLWTNFKNSDIETVDNAKNNSNDFKYIRYVDPRYRGTFKRLTPKNLMEEHLRSKNYIFEHAHKDYPEQKLWVITHHPPVPALLDDPDISEHDNVYGLVTNDYTKEIENSEIDYWIHGHNHQSGKATVGKTTILANTLGYASATDTNALLNPDFNPWMELDLN